MLYPPPKLYNQEARNFWLHNTGPLGCLPRIIATFGKNPSQLDQFGCVASTTVLLLLSMHNNMIFI
ncbi:GDSL esterase/lipase [Prunus dulcis]|uniref:GDSL esterase/lipase n=1 Tax=Prunus dulcis TaxID=3755 RepID=A0A4Y1S2E9_PRUDU|nr:GDSL esterase/lipase [Prunus dulcis]